VLISMGGAVEQETQSNPVNKIICVFLIG